jgi:hypothetical protein
MATVFEMANTTVGKIRKELDVSGKRRADLQMEIAPIRAAVKKAREVVEVIRPMLLDYCKMLENEDIEAHAPCKRKRT